MGMYSTQADKLLPKHGWRKTGLLTLPPRRFFLSVPPPPPATIYGTKAYQERQAPATKIRAVGRDNLSSANMKLRRIHLLSTLLFTCSLRALHSLSTLLVTLLFSRLCSYTINTIDAAA